MDHNVISLTLNALQAAPTDPWVVGMGLNTIGLLLRHFRTMPHISCVPTTCDTLCACDCWTTQPLWAPRRKMLCLWSLACQVVYEADLSTPWYATRACGSCLPLVTKVRSAGHTEACGESR